MDYIELTKIDLEIERKLLAKYRRQLECLPNYNMVCKQIRGKTCYYLREKGSDLQTYISNEDNKLIMDIKLKHFLEKAIPILESNIRLQEKLCKSYCRYDNESINALLPKVYQETKTYYSTPDTYKNLCNNAMHRTSFGLNVRSKSEALIAELLYAHDINFKYELPLWLKENDDILIHPDFTITTKSGTFYWEHMGMMSVPEYRDKASKRISLYASNGITIPDKLIVTMDTSDGLINMMTIKVMINSLLI